MKHVRKNEPLSPEALEMVETMYSKMWEDRTSQYHEFMPIIKKFSTGFKECVEDHEKSVEEGQEYYDNIIRQTHPKKKVKNIIPPKSFKSNA
jgi:hypothetical protein